MRCLCVSAFLLTLGRMASAQSCFAPDDGAVPTIRSEGRTELVGNAILACTGIPPGSFDVDVTLNAGSVPITSRPAEAVLTITDALGSAPANYPATLIASTTLLQDGQPATTTARFQSIAVPSPDFQLAIGGIRADASPVFVPLTGGAQFGELTESLVFSKIPIVNTSQSPVIFVAISLPALAPVTATAASIAACSASAGIAAGSVAPISVQISGNFPGSFRTQLPQQPNTLSETEFSSGGPILPAASGTQFAITFGLVSPGITLNVPLVIYDGEGGSAQLVTAEGVTTPQSSTASVAGVPVFAFTGNSTVFYNVTGASNSAHETFTVPISFAATNGTVLTTAPTVAVKLAPRATVTPSAVPRFSAIAGTGLPAPLFSLTACGLLSFAVPPNLSTAPQLVTLSGPTGAAFTTSASQPWIVITPAAGTLPEVVSISVNPAALTGQSNQGEVDISSVPGGVAPYVIPITATVSPQPHLAVTPPTVALAFLSSAGPATATQTLTLTGLAPGTPLQVSAIGSPWLSVVPASSSTGGSLTLAADAAGLSRGVYYGSVEIQATPLNAAPLQVSIPVTLTLDSQESIAVSPPALMFDAPADGVPASQSLTVADASAFSFEATANAPWIHISPAGSPNSYVIAADPTGLGNGVYESAITVTAQSSAATQIPVSLTVGPSAAPLVAGAANAASGQGPLAPGLIVSIFGSELGPATSLAGQLTESGSFSTILRDTQVFAAGIPCPLLFAQANQINAILPFELAGQTAVSIQVRHGGVSSNFFPLTLGEAAPGLFTTSGSGTGPVAAINQDGTVNSAANPAPAGSIVSLFGTGAGVSVPASGAGALTPILSPYPVPVLPIAVSIGGLPSTVSYAGSAPGETASLLQINAAIPTGLAAGPQAVILTVGTLASSSPTTLFLK